MKKFLPLFLSLILLCGCGKGTKKSSAVTPEPEVNSQASEASLPDSIESSVALISSDTGNDSEPTSSENGGSSGGVVDGGSIPWIH